jgi:hypothetical protein
MSETNLKPGVYRIETPPRPGCLQAVGTELDKPVMALPAGPTPGATQFVRRPFPLAFSFWLWLTCI